MHPTAEALNAILKKQVPEIFPLFSEKGRSIYFPHEGILGQTAEAKGKHYDATIGIALEDDRSPMRLPAMQERIGLKPENVYPYAPSFGKKELRELWKVKISEKNPDLRGTYTLPVVTGGMTHGLSVAAFLFLDPGDFVLMTDKYWDNYRLIFEWATGAKLTLFNTFKGSGFDLGSLRAALRGGEVGKKVLLLNFPNNPTGYTPTVPEAKEIIGIIREAAEEGNRVLVLLDDAYFGFVYEEDVERQSLFSRLCDLHERVLAVKIDGATKEDYVWGHRVGFITFGCKGMTADVSRALEDKAAGVVRATVSNACHLSQTLLLQAYADPAYTTQKEQKEALLRRRYAAVRNVLAEIDHSRYFTELPFNSGYFLCLELAPDLSAEEIRRVLLRDFDTGVIAAGGRLLRIAYSSVPEEEISELFSRIVAAAHAVSSPKGHASLISPH